MLGFACLIAWLTAPKPLLPLSAQKTLRVGWQEYPPYQASNYDRGSLKREGLSTRWSEWALAQAGFTVSYQPCSWSSQLKALENGSLDLVTLASPSVGRKQIADFSAAYLTLQSGTFSAGLNPSDIPEQPDRLSMFARQRHLSVAVVADYFLPPALQTLVEEARREHRLHECQTPGEALECLRQGQAQLTFLDESVGFSLTRITSGQSVLSYQNLDVPPERVCLMFRKGAVSPEELARVNQAFAEGRQDGTYGRFVRTFYYPRLLGVLTQQQLFRIVGIAAGLLAGLTGALIAHREGYDFVGALVLASCPAVGGGVLRDLVAGRNPIGLVVDPTVLFALVSLVAALGIFFRCAPSAWKAPLENLDPATDPGLQLFDALGMGAFTAAAVLVALGAGLEPLWLWAPLLSLIQNGGGSILRDLVLGRGGSIAILRGVIFGEIAFAWSLALAIFLTLYSEREIYVEEQLFAAVGATMLGATLTRALVLRFKLKAPLY